MCTRQPRRLGFYRVHSKTPDLRLLLNTLLSHYKIPYGMKHLLQPFVADVTNVLSWCSHRGSDDPKPRFFRDLHPIWNMLEHAVMYPQISKMSGSTATELAHGFRNCIDDHQELNVRSATKATKLERIKAISWRFLCYQELSRLRRIVVKSRHAC